MITEEESSVLQRIDSVYMFMWPGWRTELRSNRWHFGRRWARNKPVVMIQPDRVGNGFGHASPETRFENCTILSVHRSHDLESYVSDSLRQAGQISHHMRAKGHRRPLFWLYNPFLFGSYSILPATVRLQHATENYFGFLDQPEFFYDLYRRSLKASAGVVAVSSGVAEEIVSRIPEANVLVSPNGCDYEEYSGFVASTRFATVRKSFRKIAIYAGNVNSRIDFELLEKCASALSDTHIAVFGPVQALPGDDATRWERIIRAPNVQYGGPVRPEDLPGLYGAADVGLIPYKRVPLLEDHGFPLKALEMTATGLPVVSTYMRPLEEVGDVLSLARDHGAFVECVAGRSRASLSDSERSRMRTVCEARGYDKKFAGMLEWASGVKPEPGAQVDAFLERFPAEIWVRWLDRTAEPLLVLVPRRIATGILTMARKIWSLLPARVRAVPRGKNRE